jgi:hypothetical protein
VKRPAPFFVNPSRPVQEPFCLDVVLARIEQLRASQQGVPQPIDFVEVNGVWMTLADAQATK